MSADKTSMAAAGITEAVERCRCGRIATGRCWLGENSPARWLFACHRQAPLPDAPEAA